MFYSKKAPCDHYAGGFKYKASVPRCILKVVQAVAQLEHDKVITLDDEGNFSLVRHESAPKFPGIFHANDRGFGFVTVDPEKR